MLLVLPQLTAMQCILYCNAMQCKTSLLQCNAMYFILYYIAMQCTAFYSLLQCNALSSLHCIQLCIRHYSLNVLLHYKAIQCIVIWSKLHCIYCLHCTADRRRVYNYTPFILQHFWLCADTTCASRMLNYCNVHSFWKYFLALYTALKNFCCWLVWPNPLH